MATAKEWEDLALRYVQHLHKAEAEAAALRAENEKLREALRGLLREEPLVYEGNLEAKLYVAVDALDAARAALASDRKEEP